MTPESYWNSIKEPIYNRQKWGFIGLGITITILIIALI